MTSWGSVRRKRRPTTRTWLRARRARRCAPAATRPTMRGRGTTGCTRRRAAGAVPAHTSFPATLGAVNLAILLSTPFKPPRCRCRDSQYRACAKVRRFFLVACTCRRQNKRHIPEISYKHSFWWEWQYTMKPVCPWRRRWTRTGCSAASRPRAATWTPRRRRRARRRCCSGCRRALQRPQRPLGPGTARAAKRRRELEPRAHPRVACDRRYSVTRAAARSVLRAQRLARDPTPRLAASIRPRACAHAAPPASCAWPCSRAGVESAGAAERGAADGRRAAQTEDEAEVENALVALLGFDKFELIKELLRNRLKIVWCTRRERAQSEDERARIEARRPPGPAAALQGFACDSGSSTRP